MSIRKKLILNQILFRHRINPNYQVLMQADTNLISLISDLTSTATRELALIELSKKREMIDDLAPLLWHSFGKSLGTVESSIILQASCLRYYRKLYRFTRYCPHPRSLRTLPTASAMHSHFSSASLVTKRRELCC
jgi:hypothetical protein